MSKGLAITAIQAAEAAAPATASANNAQIRLRRRESSDSGDRAFRLARRPIPRMLKTTSGQTR